MSGWSEDLEVAVRGALAAGRAAMASFGTEQEVTHKSPDQPLTAADLEANDALRAVLQGERPDYGWLSEETADTPERLHRRRVWVVDPIDGTRSYIKGLAEWGVSVGLAEDGAAVVGVVLNPATGELFHATRGGGAWRERVGSDAPPERLSVSARDTEEQAVLLASRSEIAAGEFDPFTGGWHVAPLGSTAYKLARVASGEGDVFLSRGPKSEWDVCAGALIVEEAGGTATDLHDRPFRYNNPDPRVYGVLASNGRLHTYIAAIVDRMPPPPRLVGWAPDPLHPGLREDE